MKHSGFIVIKKPQRQVAKLFMDPNSYKEYQDGFLRKELIKGTLGQAGAVSKMYYQFGKSEMEMEETILTNRLPDFFEAVYHHKHMDNTMKCRFISIDEFSTRYEYEYEYTRINWILPKLMSILFPSMYRKPAEKWMRQFKTYVEKQ
ncbi:SRPBCC family protein [Flagellimonas sp.]|uniref:SRPBCC family protein n=1 Tax=Flagellimonas sp. TaxID=2058762 RepID=UPI003F49DB41